MKLVVTDGATLSGGGVSLDIFSQFGEGCSLDPGPLRRY